MGNTLVTKVQEDKATQDRLHDIIQRERVMADAVRQLDKDLTQDKSKTTVDAKYFRKEAHAKTCSIMRIYRQAERAQEIKIGCSTCSSARRRSSRPSARRRRSPRARPS